MSDMTIPNDPHLPECEVLPGPFAGHRAGCICDRLRACEQRVLNEAWVAVAAQFRNGRAIGGPIEDLDDLRAVFDALREGNR